MKNGLLFGLTPIGFLGRKRGFSLIELLVALAILATISAIALPLYERQTRRARRVEAQATLVMLAQAQERFFTINGSYGTWAELDAGLNNAYTNAMSELSDENTDGTPDYYTFTIALGNPAVTYQMTATANAGSAQDSDAECGSYSINQAGQRTALQSDGATISTETCW